MHFKKHIICFLFIFIFFIAKATFSNVDTFNNEKFDNYMWGSDLVEYGEFDCDLTNRNEFQCQKKQAQPNFLGISIDSIKYVMNYKKQFDAVRITFNSKSDWNKMKEKIAELLGKQYIGNLAGRQVKYQWKVADLKITLGLNPKLLHDDRSKHHAMWLTILNTNHYSQRSFQVEMSPPQRNIGTLNYDQSGNEDDLSILLNSLGQCNKPGNYQYNSDADLDLDECITENDKSILICTLLRSLLRFKMIG